MKKSIAILLGVIGLVGLLSAQPVEELMQQGNAAFDRKDFGQAVTIFRNVISREPSNFEAQLKLAQSYLGLDRAGNAVMEFNKAISMSPMSVEAWGGLALAYERQGDANRAIGALNHAIQLAPNNTEYRLKLAGMYADARQYARARAIYDQVISINGSIGEAHGEAGWIAFQNQGDSQGALGYLNRATQLESRKSRWWEGLALAHEALNHRHDALEAWRSCLRVTFKNDKRAEIQSHIDALAK